MAVLRGGQGAGDSVVPKVKPLSLLSPFELSARGFPQPEHFGCTLELTA